MTILTGIQQFSSSHYQATVVAVQAAPQNSANTAQRHCILLFTAVSTILLNEYVRPIGYVVSCMIS